jgi:hypothetical protein
MMGTGESDRELDRVGDSSSNSPVHRTVTATASAEGSHLLFVHPESGKEVWVTVHGHDAGRLGNRILRDAGVE